jgi:hypothetical protein
MSRSRCRISFWKGRVSEPPPVLLPEGKLDLPFALQPWPAEIDAKPGEAFPVVLYPAEGSSQDELRAISTVIALVRRLFESAHAPYNLSPSPQGRTLRFLSDASVAREGYRLNFSADEIDPLLRRRSRPAVRPDLAGADAGRAREASRANSAFLFPARLRTSRATAGAAAISTCHDSSIRRPTSSG